ncbi:hypothetical protein SAMN04488116_0448 [Flagellimonas flava]|uniref:Lipocalin-like domain-containing protein n=2 Tax=Flagellimonas flava TaxID=570519 RepID=A0A1M5I6R2_9FLAO|nr:hypothetical protein SAMN04488116_0448 [Allomuricauda flava]
MSAPSIIAIVIIMISCKKDDGPTPIDPIVGTWKLTGASVNGVSKLGNIYSFAPCAADDQFAMAVGAASDETGNLSVNLGDVDCYEPSKENQVVEGGSWGYKENKNKLTITLPQGTGFPIPVLEIGNIQFPNDDTLTGTLYALDLNIFAEAEDLDIILTRQ